MYHLASQSLSVPPNQTQAGRAVSGFFNSTIYRPFDWHIHTQEPLLYQIEVSTIYDQIRKYLPLNANSQRFPLPILKLPILNGQIYILNSPKLIAAIERQPKVISFWHVEASAIGRIAGLSRETHETVSKDVGDPHSFWIKGLRAIHHTMTLGEGINSMIIEAARTSAETLNLFDREGGGREVDLWDWVCHEITLSHTNAVYGQRNPYKDPQVEAAFWSV